MRCLPRNLRGPSGPCLRTAIPVHSWYDIDRKTTFGRVPPMPRGQSTIAHSNNAGYDIPSSAHDTNGHAVRPAPLDSAGKTQQVAQAWIRWGEENGYC